jgi:hypothetical protein
LLPVRIMAIAEERGNLALRTMPIEVRLWVDKGEAKSGMNAICMPGSSMAGSAPPSTRWQADEHQRTTERRFWHCVLNMGGHSLEVVAHKEAKLDLHCGHG